VTSGHHLRVKLFAGSATLSDMLALYRRPSIRGFTTNPTLMHRADVVQANAAGCHIITVTADILNKLDLVGREQPT
jgi:transaldolase